MIIISCMLVFGSFANAKYLQYPSSCEYLNNKMDDISSKRDIACYIKILTAKMNQFTPKKSDDVTTIEEIVPENLTMVFKVRIQKDVSLKKIGEKKWNDLKEKSRKQMIKKYCSSPNLPMIKRGMSIKVAYKFKNSGFNVIVNKNTCK